LQCATQGLSILKHFPQSNPENPPRQIRIKVIDKSNCWAYFDGASQNNSQVSGEGGVLYLKDIHLLKCKATFGRGTNNVAEFMALKITIMLAAKYVSFLAREVLCMFCLVCGCYLNVYTTRHLTL
jgi:hypothetical protein